MRIDVTMLKKDKDVDTLLENLVENMVKVGGTSGKLVKMGKANHLKCYNVNKLTPPSPPKVKEIPKPSSTPYQPIFHPLSPKQKEKILEALERKDTGTSVSVLPYLLYLNLGLSNPRPYHSNLTMAHNTQAKEMGEVRNVRIQIGYQAYLADFLVLDIPVDKELPLLLGRPFLRTCGAMIDMGHETMTIGDGVIKHTYYPKSRVKA
nr:hypothetical protein [Tanacetum cinerariifolium]GFC34126.1 hypothetical protein [Tanacetum cinerariifolium]